MIKGCPAGAQRRANPPSKPTNYWSRWQGSLAPIMWPAIRANAAIETLRRSASYSRLSKSGRPIGLESTRPYGATMTGFTLGTTTITPKTGIAGEYGVWTIQYTVGTLGMDEGGRIKIGTANVSDFATPQFAKPEEPNYVSCRTNGAAQIVPTFHRLGYIRPHMRTIELTVQGASLSPGEVVIVTLGDQRFGSPGMMAQTFSDSAFVFKVAVDPFQSGIFQEVQPTLVIRIVSGKPARLRVVGPSLVRPSERCAFGVRVDDRWGNPCVDFSGRVRLSVAGGALQLPEFLEFEGAGGAIRLDDVMAPPMPGSATVLASCDALDLAAESNAMVVQEGDLRLCWGDLQGQTFETAGTGTMTEYFDYARRPAVLDFVAHTAHDWQFTDEDWARLRQKCRDSHDPGRFVPILAYEWSANTGNGGDHCVFFRHDTGPLIRCSNWMIDESDDSQAAYTANDLFARLKQDCDEGAVMVIPHVGGRRANLSFHDTQLEPVIEICSCHGWSEWFYEEALTRGYRVGVVGDSDDVSCRIGANFPAKNHFGVRNGLTAVFCSELTRDALWNAISSRHCYATSGDRIYIDFRLGVHLMGSEVKVDSPPTFAIKVVGTSPIERVELRRAANVVCSWPEANEAELSTERFKVWWGGHSNKGRQKAAPWDGGIELVGPGEIRSPLGFGFHNPDHGLREMHGRGVSWHSTTYGNRHGIAFDVAGCTVDTRLLFATQMLKFDFQPTAIPPSGIWHDAGGVNRFVEVRRLPRTPLPHSVNIELRDTQILAGTHPYYLRVLQTNGEMAWSSPIFVTAQ